MGEYADYMLNGDDCQSCGEYLGSGSGFPRNCASCEARERQITSSSVVTVTKSKKFLCPCCGRKFANGNTRAHHFYDAHAAQLLAKHDKPTVKT